MPSPPRVMISSTFYDLQQVRADLRDFLEDQLGYSVLISEQHTFPVDHDADAIENCRRRVERDTDALILIIGGRYGFADPASGRSVTNIEYLAARVKGIPVFVFIQRRVIDALAIWKDNPAANFAAVVDDPRVFEFVMQIRESDRSWTFAFEEAADIIAALRVQFALVTTDGIAWRQRLARGAETYLMSKLGGQALRTAIEKPLLWQPRLFAQVLSDEVQARSEIRLQQRLGIVLGVYQPLTQSSFVTWSDLRIAELQAIIAAQECVMGEAFQEAMGSPGDVQAIVLAARQLGAVYEDAIEWSFRVLRSSGDERFVRLRDATARVMEGILTPIEEFGPAILASIREMEEKHSRGEDVKQSLVLRPTLAGIEELQEELRRVGELLLTLGPEE